ncbi:MAG: DUF1801 domain-containing protein [Dyadobacter sp.]|uniref:DUF1801 domain-containing protein n=1 Tax=Dyadobacter sp. TaxID=1914288 RepID=UPI0032676DFC
MPKEDKPASKPRAKKLTDTEQVAEFMSKLEHPLKVEIEAVRQIILNADPKISERIKWNAPSYYTTADLLTFNPRSQKNVHLVFHHVTIVQIKSALLEGDYKDRRMVYFTDMQDIENKKTELERILNEYVQLAG